MANSNPQDKRTDVQKMESAATIAEWYRLRSQGHTLQMIGDEYGCTPQNVSQRLKAYRESLPVEAAEDYIAQQMERLEEMRRAVQPGVDAGSARSIEVSLKIEERMAKLQGLDKPEKTEVTLTVPLDPHIQDILSKRTNDDV